MALVLIGSIAAITDAVAASLVSGATATRDAVDARVRVGTADAVAAAIADSDVVEAAAVAAMSDTAVQAQLAWQKPALGADHLNEVVTSGAYIRGSGATLELGYPIALPGVLNVIAAGTQVVQEYVSTQGSFARRKTSSGWGAWRSTIPTNDLQSMVADYLAQPAVAKQISWQQGNLADTDLDDVVESGVYPQGTASLATYAKHYPRQLWGVLTVVRALSTRIIQQYATAEDIHVRVQVDGVWGDWTPVGDIDRDAVLSILAEPAVVSAFRGDVGPEGPQGAPGPEGPQGLPGVDALPAAEAVAAYVESGPVRDRLDELFEQVHGTRGVTRRIYVRETGRADGDGSSAAPFRQIQEALDTLAADGPVLRGSILIDVGSGEYEAGLRPPLTRASAQDDFLKIVGTAGTDGVPTTIIRHSTGKNTGLLIEHGQVAHLENLKFVGGFSVAVNAVGNCYVWFRNIHADGQGAGVRGLSISSHVRYYMHGGIIENFTYAGIDEYFGVVRSYAAASSSADQLLIRNCKIGLRMKEACVGHLDYLRVEDCETGLELIQQCAANLKGVELRRNQVAVGIINSATHNEGSIVWGTGADANAREIYSAGMSGELRAIGWTGEDMAPNSSVGHRPLMTMANDFTERTLSASSGTGTELSVTSFASVLPRAFFRTKGKRFRLTAFLSVTGAAAGSTVDVVARIGSSILGSASCTVGGQTFIEWDVVCTSDLAEWLVRMSVSANGSTSHASYRPKTILTGIPSGVGSLNMFVKFSDAGQSARFDSIELFG